MPSLPMFQTQIVPASSAAKVGYTGTRRLMAFLLFGGSGNSQVEFKNAATDTGTVLVGANTLANTSKFVDLTEVGGVEFSTAIFCKPAGSGAICYVWFE